MAGAPTTRLRYVCAALVVVLLGAYVSRAGSAYNWDLLGYVGASLQLSGASRDEAHQRTYALVREAVSDTTYSWLTKPSPYRRTIATDPEAFAQQLPYYSSKPAYVLLLTAGMNLGVDPVTATLVVSKLAYVALGLSLWWWLQVMLGPAAALGVTALAMAPPMMLNLARLSTPDGLSVLMTLNALLLVVDRQRLVLGCGLFLLSVPVRLDNMLWVGLLAVFLVSGDRRRLIPVGVWAASAALLVLSIEHWSGFYGWRHLLYTNFVERLTYPADDHGAIGLVQYLVILIRQTNPVRLPPNMALSLLLGVLALWARYRMFGLRDRWTQLIILCLAFLVFRFLVYPGQERFFVAGYLGILLALVRTIRDVVPKPPGIALQGTGAAVPPTS